MAGSRLVGFDGAMTTSSSPSIASGTFSFGGDLTVHRLGYGAMQITGPGIWGEPADRDTCHRGAAPRRRARRRLHRHRRLLRPRSCPRTSSARRCTPTATSWSPPRRASPGRARRCGRSSGTRPTCASAPRCRCAASASRPSTCTSCTASTRTSRSRTSSASSPTSCDEGKVRHVGLSEVTRRRAARGAGDRADRQRAEPLQRGQPAERGAARALHGARHRLHPVVPGRHRPARRARTARWRHRRAHRATPAQLALAWLLRRCRSCSRSPARSRSPTSRRTARPPAVVLDDATYAELDALAHPSRARPPPPAERGPGVRPRSPTRRATCDRPGEVRDGRCRALG